MDTMLRYFVIYPEQLDSIEAGNNGQKHKDDKSTHINTKKK